MCVDPTSDPENYLWVRLGSGQLIVMNGDRLRALLAGSAPETPTEELLAGDPEWLRIYLAHCLGDCPITIPEDGPLPAWDQGWLLAVGETGWWPQSEIFDAG
jgi:hypothetical protein